MPRKPPHPPLHGLRDWIEQRGVKHNWIAQQLGYSPQYLSRVLNGTNPLTPEFRQRCATILAVPDAVWGGDAD